MLCFLAEVERVSFAGSRRVAALPLAMPKPTSPDLSGEVRKALVMACIEGFTYVEAAPVLDVELATLRVRVYRARRQLNQLMGVEVTSHDRS